MEFGPIQLIAIGFNDNEHLHERIAHRLDAIRKRGGVRLVDALIVSKDRHSRVSTIEASDFVRVEMEGSGGAIQSLIGTKEIGPIPQAIPDAMISAGVGISCSDIRELGDELKPDSSILYLLIEHAWLTDLRYAVRSTGGYPIIHGFLSADDAMTIEPDLERILKRERAIEIEDVTGGAALLKAFVALGQTPTNTPQSNRMATSSELGGVDETETASSVTDAVRAAAVAEALQTLIRANRFDETAVAKAFKAFVAAGVIEEATLQEAMKSAVSATDRQNSPEGARDRSGLAPSRFQSPDSTQSHGQPNGG